MISLAFDLYRCRDAVSNKGQILRCLHGTFRENVLTDTMFNVILLSLNT